MGANGIEKDIPAHLYCERYDMHDAPRPSSFDDALSVDSPIDDTSQSYANVISELALAGNGVFSFTDSHFFTADAVHLLSFCVLTD